MVQEEQGMGASLAQMTTPLTRLHHTVEPEMDEATTHIHIQVSKAYHCAENKSHATSTTQQ